MRTTAAGQAGDVAAEKRDRATVRPELAGDEIEERRLAGAVGPDDQTALAALDREVHTTGDAQAAKELGEAAQLERRHGALPSGAAGRLARSAARPCRQSRATPGTRPSGMKS